MTVVLARDLFTDVDATTLEAHTPNQGWTGWRQASAGNIKIQTNRARATAGVLGGQDFVVADPAIVSDLFRCYVDIIPGTTYGTAGIHFRSNGVLTGATRETWCFHFWSIAGTGANSTTIFNLRRLATGNAWTFGPVATPDVLTLGRRLVVEVNGDQWTGYIEPYGGGTPEHTFGPQTLESPTWNDATHKYFGFWRTSAGDVNTTWDNFTVEVLNQAPSAPGPFTNPTAGGKVSGVVPVAWGAATDPESDPLQYEGDLSTNGGGSWAPLFALQSGLTYQWDTAALAQGSQYALRVRAYDGVDYGPYVESGVFSLVGFSKDPDPGGSWNPQTPVGGGPWTPGPGGAGGWD